LPWRCSPGTPTPSPAGSSTGGAGVGQSPGARGSPSERSWCSPSCALPVAAPRNSCTSSS